MAKTVLELAQQLEVKSTEYQEFLSAHKSDKQDENGQPIFDMSAVDVAESKKRNDELNEIGRRLDAAQQQESWLVNQGRIESLKQVDRSIPRPADAIAPAGTYSPRPQLGEMKSLGEIVVNSNDYKFKNTSSRHFSLELPDVDLKTLISTANGFAPPNNRGPQVVPYPNPRPVFADLIPTDPTNNTIIKWMEETTFTNAAAAVSQGGLKPESASKWTEKNSVVEKIATWVPVTEEQVDDVPAFMGIVNRSLILRLQLVEATLLLTGTGVSPQMEGFLVKSGVQSQAKGGDDTQDAIYRAFTKVRWTGDAEPSGIVLHPNDWEPVRLLRTTDGIYINGSPQAPGEEMLWGKQVIVTNAITEGTGLTGDFYMFSHISRKMGIRVDVANQHDTNFIYNLLAVRAEMRESLEILRASAFTKITGI